MSHIRMPWPWLALVALVLLASLRGEAQTRSEFYYTGTMAGQPIQLDLTFAAPAITGTLLRDTDGRENNMKGLLQQGGAATINEVTAKGNSIGTLSGTFSPDRHLFSGAWRNAEGSKSMPMKLSAVAEYVMQRQTQPRLSVTSSYPRFFSAMPALNDVSRHTRESIAAQQKEFLQQANDNLKVLPANNSLSADYHFAIKYYSCHLLSLLETSVEFPGGAHPNTTFTSYNAQLDSGKAVPFDIASLFKPGTPCFTQLSDYTISELRRRGADWVTSGQIKSFKAEDLSTFFLRPTTLTIVFAPYAVGPYVQGEFYVRVPYRQFCANINPNGPLGSFMMAAP